MLPRTMKVKLLKPIFCQFCKTAFYSLDRKRSHVYRHKIKYVRVQTKKKTGYLRALNRNGMEERSSSNIEGRTDIRTLNTYRCKYCPIRFHYNSELKDHIRTHTKEKPYRKAPIKKTGTKENPTINVAGSVLHISRTICTSTLHTEKGSVSPIGIQSQKTSFYRCKYCRQYFNCKDSLDNHISSSHIYQCKYCGKFFNWESQLKIHTKTHTKPFKCDYSYCQKSFTLAGALKEHLRIHTKEKPFQCKYCEKCFTLECQLQIHIKTHTKSTDLLKCEYCQKSFTLAGDLKEHLRIHTKEKPFQCEYCEKCCNWESQLITHMNTHTKPFKCEYCQKSFALAGALKNTSEFTLKRSYINANIVRNALFGKVN
ncbi:uncharacterized protein [Amphiura filiformis]|uniref:uncharacterized protein isoform X1 n=1 Tax=Amphiura filiformis TaxID=82378 RepID=UPI003B216F69